MRNRIEDLGRVFVKIDNLLDEKIFQELDNEEQFANRLFQDEDLCAEMYQNLLATKEALFECLDILKGEDYLNRSETQS